jgi:phosphotransferase system HPr (HPr) family protein
MEWIERPIYVNDRDVFHMRSAQQMVELTKSFEADIRMITKGTEFNPKSILEMLDFVFILRENEPVAVKAKGTQALQAINALEFLFEKILKKG